MQNDNTENLRSARLAIGAFLVGFGVANFACFILLKIWWLTNGSKNFDPAKGLIYFQHLQGRNAYFSEFQVTSLSLLLLMSIPLAFVGYFVTPKIYVLNLFDQFDGRGRGRWEVIGEKKFIKWVSLVGAAASPIAICFCGPIFVNSIIGFCGQHCSYFPFSP